MDDRKNSLFKISLTGNMSNIAVLPWEVEHTTDSQVKGGKLLVFKIALHKLKDFTVLFLTLETANMSPDS